MIVLECLSCIRHQAFPEFYLRNALRIPDASGLRFENFLDDF